ncbi:MAG: DUF4434 domain-containing protein [Oscillospiraceae bacterium]|nr:DUF4434 domain-containing protein [Oscillospiraceae bacterium]
MKKLFCLLLVLACIGGTLPAYALEAADAVTGSPQLAGSFIQPPLVEGWSDAHWREEYRLMQEAGMDHLILQWTADSLSKTTIYPTSIAGFTHNYSIDVVEKSMLLGDELGMDIYVGLQLNEVFFTNYANNVPWLNQEAVYSEALVRELWARYGHHPSFKGWYVTFEVDNWNYNLPTGSAPDTNKLQNLVNYYNKLVPVIKQLSPGKPIMTSPFYNINPDTSVLQTAGWRTMWRYILERVDFTIIALQDGIGAGHAKTNQIAPWYEATLNAINDAGKAGICELWSDVEIFNSDWQPMPIGTIVADMEAVKPYVTTYTSFSFNHYMSPQEVRPEYYQTYKNYYNTGSVDSNPPSTPLSLTGTAADSSTISLTWLASSDDIGVVGYNIYRGGILVKKLYSNNVAYADTQLKENTQYQYSVSSFDAAGNESQKSNTVAVSTPAGTSFKNKYSGSYSYSIDPASTYPDSSKTKLTDGVYGSAGKGDIYSAWAGLSGGGPFVITLDLGSSRLINKVTLNFLQIKDYYIVLPNEIKIETSANGSNYQLFDTIGAASVDDADQTKKFQSINLDGATARYVKITIIPTGSAWTFIDEIELWGGFDAIAVTGVSLNKSAISLIEGESEALTATVSPANATNKNVTWSSDNPSVATVDKGVVTAGSHGTAVITATTADGGKVASCTVTVTPVTPLEFIDISTAKTGNTYTFTANVIGGRATVKYAFYITGRGKVYDKVLYTDSNSFSYTPSEAGSYTVRAYAIDAAGKKVGLAQAFVVA